MRAFSFKAFTFTIVALVLGLGASMTPASAAYVGRMGGWGGYHGGYHGGGACGLYPCRGWGGGYGGWRRGYGGGYGWGYGGWRGGYPGWGGGYVGWGPAFGLGLLGGYYGASSYYAPAVVYDQPDVDQCVQVRRVYDRHGRYLGWQRINVC